MVNGQNTPQQSVLQAVDVFAGAGGLTEGLRQAGFTVVGAIEIDRLAASTYHSNHGEVCLWTKDIKQVSAAEILEKLNLRAGELDLLAGCPPCQGFSSMRTLNGKFMITDDRNDLVFEFMRLVIELRPRAIMMENVPGLKSDARMKTILAQLKEHGYYGEDDAVQVLNAKFYGVPQNRRRMILLSSRNGKIEFAPAAAADKFVMHAIKDLPQAGSSGDPLHDYPQRRTPKVQRIIEKMRKNGGSRTELDETDQLECHKKAGVGFKDIYGRMTWGSPAPTITSGCFNPSKGRFLHPEENRAITLREAACLQSFPPDYKFSMERGITSAALMIGNALPPEFIRRHAEMVKLSLSTTLQ